MNSTNFNKILKKLQMLENAILRQVDYTESMRTKSKVTASTWSTLEYFGHATFCIFTAAACIRLNGKTEKIRIVIVS